ncbi:Superoxide dismutase [Cu-Zn] [Cichlidogyrus casuarinus]|uniref:Superoxide dismutase [Cu-Zn] n=1 Tax=Cichlidogyrus casuarinus TaxID=1844966 RepID=A0ABD2QFS4_9PLAT
MNAVCVLNAGKVSGSVRFTQQAPGEEVDVEVKLSGLEPGKHGFHVHAYGDNTNGCTSAGPHFNPQNVTHGDRTAAIRHVGDLGNVEADANGNVNCKFSDKLISLNGPNSIIGRSLVVHANEDDLGIPKADYNDAKKEESTRTGNAGERIACAVIGICDAPK